MWYNDYEDYETLLFLIDYCFSINCFCGSQVPGIDQKVVDTDCDTECLGDPNKTCGGEDRIQIYDLMSNIIYCV